MANVKIGSVLNPIDWAKKAGPAEKQAGLTDPLKALYKQFDLMPLDLLELKPVDTVQAAKDRADDLGDGGKFGKAAKTLSELAKAVVTRAKKCEADLKKDDKAPKGAAAAAGAVAQAAEALVRDVNDAWTTAQASLKSLTPKLEAEEKKEQAEIDKAAKKEEAKDAKKDKKEEEESDDDLAEQKDEKKFRDKVKSTLVGWLKRVKADGSPPAKFTVVVLGKAWGVYLAKSAGETEKKIAVRLAGVKSGFKHCKGEMFWDPKARAWVFEGATIPLGRANATAMSQALKPVIGYAPRLRLQKPGERGEDMEGGEDDPDDQPLVAGAGKGGAAGPAGVDPVKAFTARLGALQPRIKSALVAGGAAAEQIKSAVAKAGELAGKGGADAANKLLDQVEKQLGAARPAAPPATGAGAAGAAPTAAPDPALAKLGQARSEWMAARAQAVRGIEQLAQRIEQEYRDETGQQAQVKAATARLRALAGQLRADLETQLDAALKEKDANRRAAMLRTAKVALAAVVKTVAQDPLMKELDGNELMPELQIVKPMQERLREIAAVLG